METNKTTDGEGNTPRVVVPDIEFAAYLTEAVFRTDGAAGIGTARFRIPEVPDANGFLIPSALPEFELPFNSVSLHYEKDGAYVVSGRIGQSGHIRLPHPLNPERIRFKAWFEGGE